VRTGREFASAGEDGGVTVWRNAFTQVEDGKSTTVPSEGEVVVAPDIDRVVSPVLEARVAELGLSREWQILKADELEAGSR
jgi:hypothetical protein